MLLVDDRAGSRDLFGPLNMCKGVPDVQLTRLEAGDIMFMGHGPTGDWLIGIEHKTVSDIVSCVKDSRFAGFQLPKLLESYDASYLMIEGRYSQKELDGEIFVARRKGASKHHGITYEAFNGWICSMESSGLRIRQTHDKADSAAAIVAIYKWWSKDWTAHKSLKAIHVKPPETQPTGISFVRREPTNVERMLTNIVTGLGWDKAAEVAKCFKTPIEVLGATEEQLEAIKGIGPILAKRIVKAMKE